jgi:hypothetical protein
LNETSLITAVEKMLTLRWLDAFIKDSKVGHVHIAIEIQFPKHRLAHMLLQLSCRRSFEPADKHTAPINRLDFVVVQNGCRKNILTAR